ncbi:class I SAM-dependent methyltransferase [Cryobacterium sp. TMT1-19]|uniref:class I SAM-dependent methyltransferase n=1 Tax=Cryobacterium sp. TMT1-19 TaxID=1259231 RepID=UPI00106AD23A|nr:class I SAM-dependent methyltransferase [Cryobacterium sp. TMT1-19]TFD35916.1 class I SAM-dependent methyltransferase [Cryobacterium sp. TMT1-19]
MLTDSVRRAYGARAGEYTEALGTLTAMPPEDRKLISVWARHIGGPMIDAGCGPGHWTKLLHDHGVAVEGIDMVNEFIESASARFPEVSFRVATLEALPADDGTLAAVLSWYSIIHTPPHDVSAVLNEFARCIRPDGTLLLGFFEGEQIEAFDHAIVTAYYWPVWVMHDELAAAGFDIVETHTRADPRQRPHAAIIARRRN